jgi:hypothetical protein
MSETTIDEADLEAVRQLLHEVFPASDRFVAPDFLRWHYMANPDGRAVWRDAMVDSESRAHYGAIPQWYHNRQSQKLLYLSVNSATHASLRGKGMFTRLGETVYNAILAADPPAAGVIGVPNRDAYQPRIKRLAWQMLGVLPLLVNLGLPLGRPAALSLPVAEALSGPRRLIDHAMLAPGEGWRQRWSAEKLAWRANNPLQQVWVHRLSDVAALVAPQRVKGIPVAVVVKTFRMPGPGTLSLGPLIDAIRRFHRAPFVVYVGFNEGLRFPGIDIPVRFRPSPLYLGQRLFDPQVRSEGFKLECFEAFDYDLF